MCKINIGYFLFLVKRSITALSILCCQEGSDSLGMVAKSR
jgi:hypothetical protein